MKIPFIIEESFLLNVSSPTQIIKFIMIVLKIKLKIIIIIDIDNPT